MKRPTSRRTFLAGLGLGAVSAAVLHRGSSSPVALLSSTAPSGALINDASEFSATPVWKNPVIESDLVETPYIIAGAIREAAAENRQIIASAARHSMGGHSIARDGLTITMNQEWIRPDIHSKTYRVGGGVRWSSVIAALDPLGFSPAVMQSNNDFGVASTFSVNAHGWPAPYSGAGSTVRSIKIMGPDQKEIICSREENSKIFHGAMGGYGLFGVITELEVDMVENRMLQMSRERLPGHEIGTRLRDIIDQDPSVSMAYGRLDVSHETFFEDAMCVSFRPIDGYDNLPAASGSGLASRLSRPIFRAQTNNERMKDMRWWFETSLSPIVGPSRATRNSLLNEPVATLDDHDPARVDILHEYFIAPENFAAFLQTCRDVIPNSYQQLLNVTLRFVRADTESLLAYAPEDRIAAVMLFSQEKTARAEADMLRMTRLLIDGAIAQGGSYYLPYRPHATQAQFEAAYPRAAEFAKLKRKIDPEDRFSNAFWATYLRDLA